MIEKTELFDLLFEDIEDLRDAYHGFRTDVEYGEWNFQHTHLLWKTVTRLGKMLVQLTDKDRSDKNVLLFSRRLDDVVNKLLNRIVEGTLGETLLTSFINALETFQNKVETAVLFLGTQKKLHDTIIAMLDYVYPDGADFPDVPDSEYAVFRKLKQIDKIFEKEDDVVDALYWESVLDSMNKAHDLPEDLREKIMDLESNISLFFR